MLTARQAAFFSSLYTPADFAHRLAVVFPRPDSFPALHNVPTRNPWQHSAVYCLVFFKLTYSEVKTYLLTAFPWTSTFATKNKNIIPIVCLLMHSKKKQARRFSFFVCQSKKLKPPKSLACCANVIPLAGRPSVHRWRLCVAYNCR